MAGITQAQADAQLVQWLAALDKLSTGGQSYSIGGRSLTRADLSAVQDQVEFWDKQVRKLSRGGIKIRLGRPN